MARFLRRAVVAVAAVLGPLVAAAPAHAVWADNHSQALVEDQA